MRCKHAWSEDGGEAATYSLGIEFFVTNGGREKNKKEGSLPTLILSLFPALYSLNSSSISEHASLISILPSSVVAGQMAAIHLGPI